MKLVVAIIRPDMLTSVLESLFHTEVRGLTISRVQGHGGETERVETYRGATVKMDLSEKVRLETRQRELEQEWESGRTRVTQMEDCLRMGRQTLQEVRERRPVAPEEERHADGHPHLLALGAEANGLDPGRDELRVAGHGDEPEVGRDAGQLADQVRHIRLVARPLAAEHVGVDHDHRSSS